MDATTSRSDLLDAAPDLLLVELDDPRRTPAEQLVELLTRAREVGIPACLWLTDPTYVPDSSPELVRAADLVFSTDPGLWPALPGLGDRQLIGAPHAASHTALSVARADLGTGVGLIVEARTPWTQQVTPGLELLIEVAAAEHPFEVLMMEPLAPGLPAYLEGMVRTATGEDARVAFMMQRGALVGGSPPAASWLYAPAVVFDAVGIGTPVVVAASRGVVMALQRTPGVARTAGQARTLLIAALTDGEIASGRAQAGRAAVRNEHTYAHRLAMIASAVGHRILPVLTGTRIELC